MAFRPSCIVCCSDCDAGGLFTSCHHFLCVRCVARYPPGQCPRCSKPCRAVKAGPDLPKEIADRVTHDPLQLLQLATQALDFQRRQEQQALQRLRELVATLNQSNRTMASQISAAKAEREELVTTIKRLQEQLCAHQQQSQQQLHRASQRSTDISGIGSKNVGQVLGSYGGGAQGTSMRATPQHDNALPGFSHGAPAAARWLSSPGVLAGATDSLTPLGWSQSKRLRGDDHRTPVDDESMRFRLATPAITLRAALSGSREPPLQHLEECSGAMGPPRPLKSLLCRGA
uniref:RING-type domain-containing protein n=1 Tax=Trypanosoma congolense (strain IL3000) TaxID=1068625 RepID=G0V089_TRYCI|nr:conserved hypothetical protein [Trypanosoma congolense IL3000]